MGKKSIAEEINFGGKYGSDSSGPSLWDSITSSVSGAFTSKPSSSTPQRVEKKPKETPRLQTKKNGGLITAKKKAAPKKRKAVAKKAAAKKRK